MLENRSVPVLGFAAYSGTGKTTLVEKIVTELTRRGLNVATIKHDAHGLTFDHEGKDSWRFSRAGASFSAVSGPDQAAVFINRSVEIDDLFPHLMSADIVLVEGYKKGTFSQIGINRKATGKGFTDDVSRFVAVVTDEEVNDNVTRFDFGEVERIADFIMQNMDDFTHFNEKGMAKMVDVGEKPVTERKAIAAARVLVSQETFNLIKTGGMKKGDVLTVAQVAGIMGAKHTPDIIPMCHPVGITGIDMDLSLNEEKCSVEIEAQVSCGGKTGVEMEALNAVSIAALTVYDMCKAVQKDIVITDIRLVQKSGGIHGDYQRKED